MLRVFCGGVRVIRCRGLIGALDRVLDVVLEMVEHSVYIHDHRPFIRFPLSRL